MVKLLTAFTYEADDENYALDDLLEQLDLENNALKYCGGFMTFHSDFVGTGVAAYISGKLPFDVIGCTTMASYTADEKSETMLSISVFTSDDVTFSAFMTNDILSSANEEISSAFKNSLKDKTSAPSFMFTATPLCQIDGDTILQALNQASGGIPIYGMTAYDDLAPGLTQSHTICNGVLTKNSLAVLQFFGTVDVDFYVESISEECAQKFSAIITKAEGPILMEVNDMSLIKYFNSIGIITGDSTAGFPAVPLMIDYNDGSKPIARAIYSTTPQGYASCGGIMPVNSRLSIISINKTDIVKATSRLLDNITPEKHSCAIFLPCGSRYAVLGADKQSEMNLVEEKVSGKLPFYMAYAGGETCPVYSNDKKPINRFHNFTFVACAFRK